ncbi:MAG: DNA gyrase inhibitor YacG [Acidobacteria bacterium]|nr:DNA gyrase inhibitor YacG [Acidobacteriota bacterium]
MPRRVDKPKCPICRKAVKKSDPEFPFCSERCRLLDLGRWLNGGYRIAVPLPDSAEAAPDADDVEPGSGERK